MTPSPADFIFALVFTVYILESIRHPGRTYTGSTSDLALRLREHNEGKSPHTSKYVPWRIVVSFSFADPNLGHLFEHYLKTGSGREFARRHFLPPRDAASA